MMNKTYARKSWYMRNATRKKCYDYLAKIAFAQRKCDKVF